MTTVWLRFFCRPILAVLLIAVFSYQALASDPVEFIVRVTSIKHNQSQAFNGSGVLVQFNGRVYVLTSEHVVLHDNDRTVHQFQLDQKPLRTMSFLASDWANGLALLNATDVQPNENIPRLEDLTRKPSPSVDEPAMSVGFPYRSTSIVADAEGKVASTTNVSSILVDVERMIEIKQAHAEFGMSGGAVLDGNAEVIGILSHETPTREDKILFAIPISQAAAWAIRVLSEPDFKPRLVRTSDDMLAANRRGLTVRSQQLAFSTDVFAYNRNITSIEVSGVRKTEAPSTHLFEGTFMERAFARIEPLWREHVPVGYHPRVTVTGFRPVSMMKFHEPTQKITSLVEFFRALRNPAIRPIALFQTAGTNLERLGRQRGQINSVLQNARYSVDRELAAPLGNLAALLEHYPIYYLNTDDLDWLMSAPEHQSAWRNLRQVREEFSGPIFREIEDLRKLIDTISL